MDLLKTFLVFQFYRCHGNCALRLFKQLLENFVFLSLLFLHFWVISDNQFVFFCFFIFFPNNFFDFFLLIPLSIGFFNEIQDFKVVPDVLLETDRYVLKIILWKPVGVLLFSVDLELAHQQFMISFIVSQWTYLSCNNWMISMNINVVLVF